MPGAQYAIRGRRLDDRVYSIALAGEFDLLSAEELREALREALRDAIRRDVAEIQVSLDDTTFIDSTTIRILVQAAQQAQDTGVLIRVLNAHGLVRRVLEVAGVWRFLNPPSCTGEATPQAASDGGASSSGRLDHGA